MGDEETDVPKYVYEGARTTGETIKISAGEEPKVINDRELTLLGDREGVGKATHLNGDVYEGSYVHGVRDGVGRYDYASPPPGEDEEPKGPKATYEGQWKLGSKALVGTMTYATGHKYQGSFKEGKFEGEGTMFYPNGDIYTGAWAAGKKDGIGTYVYRESGARIKGKWIKNVLAEGAFIDKFDNVYTGQFAADETNVRFNAGGAFTLASGTSALVPSASGMVWTKSYGALCTLQCKSDEAAAGAIAVCGAHLGGQLAEEKGAAYATLLGKLAPTPSDPKYPALMPLDQSKAFWLEQFATPAAFEAHKASARTAEVMPNLLRYGATGTGSDLSSSLECEMAHLEKPRASTGACYVRMIAMTAKEEASVPALVDFIKGEVVANMTAEPGFLRGTLIYPTKDAPKTLRWIMHWTTREELDAHVMYPHHKGAMAKVFPLVDMTAAGGALEFPNATSFAK
mmetsp:Transcript_26449/g.67152  ORF Transcript_26449/g.67152 Transcript_26449/m.67152 type:complete len:456 (+) Transcript_26449:71-1438(+)